MEEDLITRRSTAVIRFIEGGGASELEKMTKLIERHNKEGVTTFLLEFEGVNYISSTAIAILVRLKKFATDNEKDLQLINVSQQIHEILRTTRLLNFFFPDEFPR